MTSGLNLHGKVEFHWEGNMFVMKCVGPFNLESLTHHFQLVRNSIEQRSTQHWVRLEIVDEDSLAPPDGMAFATEYFSWAVENGCQKAAFVTQSAVLHDYLSGLAEFNIRPFYTEQLARQWLASQD